MNYELTVILPGTAKETKKKSVAEKIGKFIENSKGNIDKLDEWGVLELMHTINKESNGLFLHYRIELKSSELLNLTNKLKMEDDIIRYLLVRE